MRWVYDKRHSAFVVRRHVKAVRYTFENTGNLPEGLFTRYKQILRGYSRYDQFISDWLQISIILFYFIIFLCGIGSERVGIKDFTVFMIIIFTGEAERTSIWVANSVARHEIIWWQFPGKHSVSQSWYNIRWLSAFRNNRAHILVSEMLVIHHLHKRPCQGLKVSSSGTARQDKRIQVPKNSDVWMDTKYLREAMTSEFIPI